jgi:LPXTG-motif cell wall-anchored protein
MNASSDDGFLSYGVLADVDYDDGSLTLPGNAQITMRVVPDYGYQVTSVNGGSNFTTTNSGVSEFTVTVADGTAGYFQAEVTRVDDEVLANSDKVSSGTIEIANNEINSGTVQLSVDDVELTSDKIKEFNEAAGSNLKINSYLDINLNKVLYKGTADDVWSEQIHHLNNKALITLQLEEGVDVSNLVIVHNIDDGDEFEIIEIESYDPETNTITFYTNSFSNYAIATKTSTQTDNNSSSSATTSTTTNPKTGDNITTYFIILILSIVGLIGTSLIVNKRSKFSKN